jgi:hypothetical protein
VLAVHDDHELARSSGLRHQRMADLEHVRDVGVVVAADDLERRVRISAHRTPCVVVAECCALRGTTCTRDI